MVLGHLDQFLDQLFFESFELRPISIGEHDLEGVGGQDPPGRDRPAQVHLPRQAPTDLYRLQAAAEHPCKSSLYEAFEASLEPL